MGEGLGGGEAADHAGDGGGPVGGVVGVSVAVGQGRANAHRPAECGHDQAPLGVVAGAGGHGVGQAGGDGRVVGVVAEGAGVGRAAGDALALRRQPALARPLRYKWSPALVFCLKPSAVSGGNLCIG